MHDSTKSIADCSDVEPLAPGEIALVELQPELVVCYDTWGLLLGRFCGPLAIAERLRGHLRSGVTYVVKPGGERARAYTVGSLDEGLRFLRDIRHGIKNEAATKEKALF